MVLFLSLSWGFIGCDTASKAPGTAVAVTPAPTTPQSKLERAMERLRVALLDAQAAAGSGVVSERESDYRLIPPEDEKGKYEAEVTIRTTIALAKAPAAIIKPEEIVEDELVEGGEIVPDNGVTRKAAAQSKSVQTDVYRLAYEGDRWKLITEPKGETEQLLFEYALEE